MSKYAARIEELNSTLQTAVMDGDPVWTEAYQRIVLRLLAREGMDPELLDELKKFPDLVDDHMSEVDHIRCARAVDAIFAKVAQAEETIGRFADREIPAAMVRGLDVLYPAKPPAQLSL